MSENPLSTFVRKDPIVAGSKGAKKKHGHTKRATAGGPTANRWLDELLVDPITAQLIGKGSDLFATKWRKCFSCIDSADSLHWYTLPFSSVGLIGNFSWDNVKSLIWPAILGPYWFAYRKLYGPALAISIISLLSIRLPSQWILLVTLALMFSSLYYAPAIYLCHIRDAVSRVKKLSAPEKAQSDASGRSPTSWVAVVVLVAAYAAVNFGIDGLDGFSLGGSLSNISACNSSRVKNLVLEGTFIEPRNQAVKKITIGEVALIAGSVDPRSVAVNINHVRQISYDPSNKIRQCVADYSVEAPITEQTSNSLAAFGVSPDKLVPVFVMGWRNNGVQFGICNGEIYYTIQMTLENKERVGWRCISRR